MDNQPPSRYRAVRALLFDLGNVLIDVDFHRCARIWSAHSGVPAETLAARFHIDAAYRAFECGTMNVTDYVAALGRQLGINLPESVFREGWRAILQGERPGIRACLARLRRHYPLYVLTNTNAEHEGVWSAAHRELLALFETVFVSSRMGCRKPDAETFHHVARSIGEPCDRILFFDDAEENVAAARRCGMPAVRVDDVDTVPRWTARLVGAPPTQT